MTETLKQWMTRVTQGASLRAIASAAGIKQATLARQAAENRISPESVVAIAHTYNANVLEGLIAQRLLRPDDITQVREVIGLREASDRELADEILRRLNERGTDTLNSDEKTRAPRMSVPRLTLLSDDAPKEWEDMPYAADTEHPGDDPGEDD
ncbi:hypothetical protein [Devriesea agamarum]|uniref:hypothetical protein n=1 Tax=Devriesea agamarum TaxID=472569 RepID=UPI00071D6C63|nr:hypothetical protein [Devriesea agamarum]